MSIIRIQSATVTGPSALPEPSFPIGPGNPDFIVSLPFIPTPGNVLIAFGGEEPGGGSFEGLNTNVDCDPVGLTGSWNRISVFNNGGSHMPGISIHLVETSDPTDWYFGRCNPISPQGMGRNPTTRLTVVEYQGIAPYPLAIWDGVPPVSTLDDFDQTLTPGVIGELLYLACSPWLPTTPDFGVIFGVIDTGDVLAAGGGTSFGYEAAIADQITTAGFASVPVGQSMSMFAFGPAIPVGVAFPYISYWQICATGAFTQRTLFGWDRKSFTTDGGDTVTISGPFLAGSTSVFLAGARQRLGIDYTENPSAGSVTFTSTPAADIDGEIVFYSVDAAMPGPGGGGPVPGARYIAPSGDDDTGNGSSASPWRTVAKFASVAVAGDTLYCRGGAYPGTTTTIVDDVSGSSGSPITIAAYPGETPVFQGLGEGTASAFLQLQNGVSYWTVDGLYFEEFDPVETGIIWIGDASLSTHHHIVRNCHFTATPNGTIFDQQVYLSYNANDCTVEGNTFIGSSVGGDGGAAVNIGGHDPGPEGFLVQRNIFDNFGNTAAVWVGSEGSAGSILHNTFVNCDSNIFLGPHLTTILVRDNAGEDAINGTWANIEDDNPSATTEDHNFWAQTFDAGYHITAGAGIGGASDSGDAGAL